MAKSINEINAVNSLQKAQTVAQPKKPRVKGAAKRAKAAGAGAQTRVRKASTPSTQRAAQKKAQRTAARALFQSDVRDFRNSAASGGSVRANNLAVTSPLATLAPGATLQAVPGRAPVLMFEPMALPEQVRIALPKRTQTSTRPISIGALYTTLAASMGANYAFAACETILQQRWDAFVAMNKSWQESEALNAKLDKEASIRAQQLAAQMKTAHDASQAQMNTAVASARAELDAKHAAVRATVVRRKVRPRVVTAPVRTSVSAAPARGVGGRVVATTTVDSLDNSPVAGLALTAPAVPESRPAPASPQERGARQAKRLRQSADADMI